MLAGVYVFQLPHNGISEWCLMPASWVSTKLMLQSFCPDGQAIGEFIFLKKTTLLLYLLSLGSSFSC